MAKKTKTRGRVGAVAKAAKAAEKMRPKEGSVSVSVTDPITGKTRTATLGADGSGSASEVVEVAEVAVRGAHEAAGFARLVPDAERVPTVRLRIPTDIGQVCSKETSRYAIDAVAVIRSPECPDDVILAATDGRMLALVSTTIEEEGDCDGAGLVASWVPRDLARVGKSERTLRMAHGAKDGLFGSTRTWVDDSIGVFAPHPEGGTFPPISDVLPAHTDAEVYIQLDAARLLAMAKAINTPGAENRDALTLVIRKPKTAGSAVEAAVGLIGDAGIGVLSPIKCDQGQEREIWTRARRVAIAASEASAMVKKLPDENE